MWLEGKRGCPHQLYFIHKEKLPWTSAGIIGKNAFHWVNLSVRRTGWAKSAMRCSFAALGMKTKLSGYTLTQRLIVTNNCILVWHYSFFLSCILRIDTNESEIVGLKCCTSLIWAVFPGLKFPYFTAILTQVNDMKGYSILLLTCIWWNRANKTHALISHRPRYGSTQEARKINSLFLEEKGGKNQEGFS